MPDFTNVQEDTVDTLTGWQIRRVKMTIFKEEFDRLGFQDCEFCGKDKHWDEPPTKVTVTETMLDEISASLSNSISSSLSSELASQLQDPAQIASISAKITAEASTGKISSQSIKKQIQHFIGSEQTFSTRKHATKVGEMLQEPYGLCGTITLTVESEVLRDPHGNVRRSSVDLDVDASVDFCRRGLFKRSIDCEEVTDLGTAVSPEPVEERVRPGGPKTRIGRGKGRAGSARPTRKR